MADEILMPVWSKTLAALASVRRRAERGAIDAEALRKEVVKLIEEADRDIGRMGDDGYHALNENAKFAVVALADELAIHAPWPEIEVERWRDRILELQYFGSNLAGDEFFDRVDTLLANDRDAEAEVREVYLMCLLLGFRGRFRQDDEGAVKEYIERLYDSIGAANRSRVCAEAYTQVHVAQAEGLHRRAWMLALVFVGFAVVCLFVLSTLMTQGDYDELSNAATELSKTAGTAEGG